MLIKFRFWVYGGAFITGRSSQAMYDGEFLAASQDVVVVSFNYRLNGTYLDGMDDAAPSLFFINIPNSQYQPLDFRAPFQESLPTKSTSVFWTQDWLWTGHAEISPVLAVIPRKSLSSESPLAQSPKTFSLSRRRLPLLHSGP